MGKSTINDHVHELFVCLPEGIPGHFAVFSAPVAELRARQDKSDDPITGPDEKCVYWCAVF